MISYGPASALAGGGGHNRFTFALTGSDKIGLTQQLQHLAAMRDLQGNLLDWLYDLPSPLDSITCLTPTQTIEMPPVLSVSYTPNPASMYLNIRCPESSFREVAMFDFLGKKVLVRNLQAGEMQELTLETNSLVSGIYLLQWVLENGQRGEGKVVVVR